MHRLYPCYYPLYSKLDIDLCHVTTIEIHRCSATTGTSMLAVTNIKSLKCLKICTPLNKLLKSNNHRCLFFTNVAALPQLEYLYVDNTKMDDDCFGAIAATKSLKTMELKKVHGYSKKAKSLLYNHQPQKIKLVTTI